jgi:hypothetical protein
MSFNIEILLSIVYRCIQKNCYLPLETVNPLKTKTTKIVMEASVLDTTLVLPIAAMKRKRDSAI